MRKYLMLSLLLLTTAAHAQQPDYATGQPDDPNTMTATGGTATVIPPAPPRDEWERQRNSFRERQEKYGQPRPDMPPPSGGPGEQAERPDGPPPPAPEGEMRPPLAGGDPEILRNGQQDLRNQTGQYQKPLQKNPADYRGEPQRAIEERGLRHQQRIETRSETRGKSLQDYRAAPVLADPY